MYEQGAQNPQRTTKYTPEIWSQFNFEGIRFPTPFKDIGIFERNNSASVNVYGLEKDDKGKYYVYPIQITPNFIEEKHFDLLYLQEDDVPDRVNGHYCLITDLARLVHKQITTYHRPIFICRRCLKHFGRQDLLDSHKRFCESRDPINAAMPSGDRPVTKFKNLNKIRVWETPPQRDSSFATLFR